MCENEREGVLSENEKVCEIKLLVCLDIMCAHTHNHAERHSRAHTHTHTHTYTHGLGTYKHERYFQEHTYKTIRGDKGPTFEES